MSKVPSASVLFRLADAALEQPQSVLLIAPISSAGTGTPDTPTRVLDSEQGAAFFGESDGVAAVARFFELAMQADFDLYAFGVDASTWTTNTWEVTITGTSTKAGTNYWRFGSYQLPVGVPTGTSNTAHATLLAAALAASDLPLTAVVDGVNANQVNITSTDGGEHIARTPLSVDLYAERGESGVAGVSFEIVNNADATGSPTFDSTNIVQDHTWYLHPFHSTSWFDDIEEWLVDRWENSQFPHAITARNDTSSATVTLFDARNDFHSSYVAAANAPEWEIETAINMLNAIQGTINTRGETVPQTIDLLLTMNRPTIVYDKATLLDAGAIPLRAAGSSTFAIRVVTNRRKTDGGQEDLRVFGIDARLRVRVLGRRLGGYLALQLDKAIVDDVAPLSPGVALHAISLDTIRAEISQLVDQAIRDAVIDLPLADAATVIQTVELITEGGIKTGFNVRLNPRIVQNSTTLSALVSLR